MSKSETEVGETMFVISQNRGIMINMDYVERVYVTEKEGKVLIAALIHNCDVRSAPNVTLGRYEDMDEAKDILWRLMTHANDYDSFEMPESKKYEVTVKDARVKRRGGS